MPMWLNYPVHNRREWEQLKAERLQPRLTERVPADWPARLERYSRRDFPLCLGAGLTGYFGTIRQLLGLELTLTTFYDDPAWRDLPAPPANTAVFIDAISEAMVPPPLPFYSTGEFRQAMLDGIDGVLLGQMDAETAVNNMAEQATASLQE